MGKITLIIQDDVEEDLRDYVAQVFPRETYGKLGEVTSKALRYYLDHIVKFSRDKQ